MKLDVRFIKSVLTIYDELLTNGISLVYLGEFSHQITKMFTSMAEDDMDKNHEELSVKRKVYHVMVETLQNMNKHSDEIAEQGSIGKGLFMIGKKDETYYVITSNKVSRDKQPVLENMLEQINAASKAELKEMYRKQIKEGKISSKGGAGLGLIDIARKTTGKHDYHFLPYDEENSFFILKVEINTKRIRKEIQEFHAMQQNKD
ncbi:hypothetical protein BKI52_12365 [marine bacterium AO1-C]|nr:hypothetical protein BKI52_12365 [marine bacterium AO1-C]